MQIRPPSAVLSRVVGTVTFRTLLIACDQAKGVELVDTDDLDITQAGYLGRRPRKDG